MAADPGSVLHANKCVACRSIRVRANQIAKPSNKPHSCMRMLKYKDTCMNRKTKLKIQIESQFSAALPSSLSKPTSFTQELARRGRLMNPKFRIKFRLRGTAACVNSQFVSNSITSTHCALITRVPQKNRFCLATLVCSSLEPAFQLEVKPPSSHAAKRRRLFCAPGRQAILPTQKLSLLRQFCFQPRFNNFQSCSMRVPKRF